MSKSGKTTQTQSASPSREFLVINGVIVTAVSGVYGHYTPTPARIPKEQWQRIRPLVVTAVRAAGYPSIHGTHFALRATSGFVAHCQDRELPLDPEVMFLPDLVEHYIGTTRAGATMRTRANERAVLRRVGRAATKRAPWPPEPKPFQDHVHLKPPYTDKEIAGFWKACESQTSDHHRHVMTALLVLGLGAGLKPREVLDCTARQVKKHKATGLTAIFLADRTVPVISQYADRLLDLCHDRPDGSLVGPWNRASKDPFTNLRKGLRVPPFLPALAVPRLRTTWMANVLAQDLRISEFMVIAGTVSAKSLECIAPFVAGRWDENVYLLRGAAL
ncbi:MAG: hypothetical protein L0H96_18325 [Humibacillus sp.]|nr:hypothetical protein [Humibacillus sp.]MDN5778855.1 hypothetical protein [Humibacillus sp.]